MITEEAAKIVLDPYHDAFFRLVTRAFERFQAGPISLTALPSPKYKATTMHELMMDEARLRFSDVEGVEILEGQNFLLRVEDRLFVRFKKVDRELRTSNYPTARAVAFDAQVDVDGLAPLPRITLGYQPDRTWNSLSSVVVMLAKRKYPLWNYELTGQSAHVQPMSPLADKVIVKPKSQVELFDLANDGKKRP